MIITDRHFLCMIGDHDWAPPEPLDICDGERYVVRVLVQRCDRRNCDEERFQATFAPIDEDESHIIGEEQ